MWRFLLGVVVAIIQLGTKLVVSEQVCIIGTVSINGVGSSRWVLPYRDPCVCSAIRLGGNMPHNEPSYGRYLDGLFVSEDSGEIQTFFDCPATPRARCDTPSRLGLEHGTPLNIPDENFSASSIDDAGNFQSTPSLARLNFLGESPQAYNAIGGWKPKDLNGCWIQVKLGRDVIITGVITQGRALNDGNARDNWVTRFQVKYATVTNPTLVDVTTQSGTPKIFDGNTDGDTEVANAFWQPVEASTIRLLPVEWHSYAVLRFELLGCLQPAETSQDAALSAEEQVLFALRGQKP